VAAERDRVDQVEQEIVIRQPVAVDGTAAPPLNRNVGGEGQAVPPFPRGGGRPIIDFDLRRGHSFSKQRERTITGKSVVGALLPRGKYTNKVGRKHSAAW
jgi:hypothetical protein